MLDGSAWIVLRIWTLTITTKQTVNEFFQVKLVRTIKLQASKRSHHVTPPLLQDPLAHFHIPPTEIIEKNPNLNLLYQPYQ